MSRERFDPLQARATREILLELAEIFEGFPGAVIVGGTVPILLIPQDRDPHEGTVDVDVVMDRHAGAVDPELTLKEILLRRLFDQDTKQPFRFSKSVAVGGESRQVIVDFLTGGDISPSGSQYNAKEEIYLSVIPGLEIALTNPKTTTVEGNQAAVLVAGIHAFLTMKAFALDGREHSRKSKDAYDIVYCLRNYPGGADAIASELKEFRDHPVVAEALKLLASLFEEENSVGPLAYSSRAEDEESLQLMRKEAFERVQALLSKLKV